MKFEKLSLVLAASILVVACGGGGGAGTTPFGGGPSGSDGSTGGSGDVPGTDVASTASAMSFVSVSPSSDPLLIQGATAQGRSDTGVLKFKVVDQVGAGVPNQSVKFTVSPANDVTLNLTTAVTDKDGFVSTSVTSKSKPTTVVVTAVLASNSAVKAVSNALNVSGGDPVQTGFQIVAEKYNLDGRFIGDDVKVTAYVGDVNGNPVPDGFAVNFTTDEGNVEGGCSTEGGRCSVVFRVQNPRTTGLATVTATGVTGNTTVTDSIILNMAGLSDSYRLTASQGVNTAATSTTLTSCKEEVVYYFNDGSGRSVAAGSKITVTTVNNGATATVKVGSPALDQLDGDFSPNLVVIAYDLSNLDGSNTCQVGGSLVSDVRAILTLETPNGVQSQQQITLTYPAAP